MMQEKTLKCPECQGENVSLRGWQKGKRRCYCKSCSRWFQKEYKYNACKPGVKDQILTLANKGKGVRDTARTLNVSTRTVMEARKRQAIIKQRNEDLLSNM